MPLNAPLYERSASAPPVPRGIPLVIALTGFTDAGNAVSRLVQYFRDEANPVPMVQFTNDVLLDYRARRPIITFDRDHLSEFRMPRLELSLAHDAFGTPFLLLAGYEPDFAWDAFADAVVALADEYGASTVTWVHAIPMPVPHTRPIGTTVSGTRTELTKAHSVWQPQTQVPSTAGHLLEYRFAATGARVSGFVLLIPHYLGDTDYPAAALAALDSLTAATGLVFAGEDLRDENKEYLSKVEDQVEGSDELSRMIHTLEERYDAYMAGATQATPMIHTGDLPSADELAAELERFLATRPPDDDKRG
ncbi:PAC2 family protein [Microbacterium sp. NPDC077184]|uniref:PAC2 family protein n=1 Tax=Microbacterium sp. NPDC077184 TaxID=3154764 RepID=UPI00342F6DF9